MKLYNDLSPAEKKWVNMVIHTHPEITDKITFSELKSIHSELFEKRKEHTMWKVSFPNWLIKNNKIGRGIYKFPHSNAKEEVDTSKNCITIDIDPLERDYILLKTQFGV